MLVSMDIKPGYKLEDFYIVLNNGLTIAFGALMQSTSSKLWCNIWLIFSCLTFGIAMWFIYRSLTRLKDIIAEPTVIAQDNGYQDYAKLIAAKRLTLTYYFLSAFIIFPMLYFLRWFGLIDDDILFVSYLIASSSTKIIFATICTDAHMEVSHPSIALLVEEKKSHDARREFLRYIFHEIRVPLHSISMGIQFLGDSNIDPQSSEGEVVMMLHEATLFMGETLDDVQALQRIEEGGLVIVRKPFLIAGLLTLSIEPFLDLAKAKGVHLTTKLHTGTPPCVVGDKYRLKHVLSNIISNAIKFTEAGTSVCISVLASLNGSTVKSKMSHADSSKIPAIDHNDSTGTTDVGRVSSGSSSGDSSSGRLPSTLPSPPRLPLTSVGTSGEVAVYRLLFQVTDQGCGIPPDKIGAVFSPFQRLPHGGLQTNRGTGERNNTGNGWL